jgi:hypothetical protein
MPSVQEQYAESLRTSQAAVVQAIESWTKSAQNAFTAPAAGVAATVSPDQVIDQVFDFAEQMLAVQRKFAKTLATQAAEAAATAARSS